MFVFLENFLRSNWFANRVHFHAKDLFITSTVQGRKIVIIGLTGTRCLECGEQYVDAESSRKTLKIAGMHGIASKKLLIPPVVSCNRGGR